MLNTIVPSWPQLPPAPPALHSVCGGPPLAAIFSSLCCAKYAMNRLSGDQNGYAASSVPGSGCAIGWGPEGGRPEGDCFVQEKPRGGNIGNSRLAVFRETRFADGTRVGWRIGRQRAPVRLAAQHRRKGVGDILPVESAAARQHLV